MPRQPQEIKVVHASADYYEALFRARFVKSMRLLQSQTSLSALAMAMGSVRRGTNLVQREELIKALEPAKKVLVDAFMRGGKLGAEHVKKALQ